mgnify:CR=1 FL=1
MESKRESILKQKEEAELKVQQCENKIKILENRKRHLEKKADNGWLQLNTAKTDKDGRIKALWPEQTATTGDYRVVFKTGDYFKKQNLESFFPEIPVEFHINKVNEHYHVPLLLSQYGYSTYRGS